MHILATKMYILAPKMGGKRGLEPKGV